MVEDGETLATIGKRYRTAPGTIAAANNLRSLSPTVGDRLLIPASFHESPPAGRSAALKSSHTHRTAAAKGRKTTAHHRQPAAKSHIRRAGTFPEASGKVARLNP